MNHEQLQVLSIYLSGYITLGHLTAGVFFLRFWKQTNDRLFVMFMLAFWLLGAIRVLMIFQTGEDHVYYWVRLAAYVIILAAIVDKNLRRSTPGLPHPKRP
jgi:Family of unknown function (DUF5985)